jgi:hypothetical protein
MGLPFEFISKLTSSRAAIETGNVQNPLATASHASQKGAEPLAQ